MARTSEYREPRTFRGHPLTPQKVPLDAKGRREAAEQIRANDEAVANPVLLEHLIAQNELLHQIRHAIKPARRRVLWSGLANLDATGVWSHRAGGGIASGSIWIYSPSVPLIVTSGTRQAAPPNFGPGVFLVPPNEALTLNAHTEEWTLYGNGTAGPIGLRVTQPAASADWSYQVTSELALTSITAIFAASATAGTRYPYLNITDPAGNLIYSIENQTGVVATAGRTQVWAGSVVNTNGYTMTLPLPALTLQPGSTIATNTQGLLAGDQWSSIVISGSEATGPASGATGALVNVTIFSDPQVTT